MYGPGSDTGVIALGGCCSDRATGPDNVHYGGSTCCLALADDRDSLTLILDGRTQAHVGWHEPAGPWVRGPILLSRLHVDITHPQA